MRKGFGFGPGIGNKSNGVSYDAVASAYFAAVPNAFDAARKTIINTLIAGLRADGNLTKLDRLWLLANTTTGNAVIDVIGLNAATLVNAPAFVADQGYTGDGATSYINSNFIASSNGVNYIQDSFSMGVYSRTDRNATDTDIGMYSASLNYSLIQARTGGKFTIYPQITALLEVVTADSLGMFSFARTASNAFESFKNGTSAGSGSNPSDATLPTEKTFILALNNDNESPANFSQRQTSIAFLGGGTIDQAAMYTRIQTYMTSLGTQV